MNRLSGIAACLLMALPLTVTGQATPTLNFRVALTGAEEVPPVETDTTGVAMLQINRERTEISYDIDIVDAVGILGVAGAHFHCAPAGTNGSVVAVLAGATGGPGLNGRVGIQATLHDENITDDVCGATIAELTESIQEGKVYINVHSAGNPAGEIRGQIR